MIIVEDGSNHVGVRLERTDRRKVTRRRYHFHWKNFTSIFMFVSLPKGKEVYFMF